MNYKYLSAIIISVMLITLVFSLLRTSREARSRENTRIRLYNDFSGNIKNKQSNSDQRQRGYSGHSYFSSEKVRRIKSIIYADTMEATIAASNNFDPDNDRANKPSPTGNSQYDKMVELSSLPLPEYQTGLNFFSEKRYKDAIKEFLIIQDKLDPMDLQHRIDCYKMLAECYFYLKSKDEYIQNKIRQIRMERKRIQLLKTVFPSNSDVYDLYEFTSTPEASRNLLKLRSAQNRGDNSVLPEHIRRAEYDLEVARKVSK